MEAIIHDKKKLIIKPKEKPPSPKIDKAKLKESNATKEIIKIINLTNACTEFVFPVFIKVLSKT